MKAMKQIKMKHYSLSNTEWEETEDVIFWRVSRWISVRQNYNPCKRNSLWDYVRDEYGRSPYDENFSPENGLYLDYFIYEGKTYAIEQFLALGNPFWCPTTYSYEDEQGKRHFLSGVDADNYYNPIYVEFDEYCERVRVYEMD